MRWRGAQRIRRCLLAAALFTLGGTIPVSADHIAGIRISRTDTDADLTVDIDVTVFHWSGTRTTTGLGMRGFSPHVNPSNFIIRNAIHWGDGAVLSPIDQGVPLVATNTVVNGVPVRALRGSFSHTYGTPGNYHLRAWTRDGAQLTYTSTYGQYGVPVVTGNGSFIYTDSYPAYSVTFVWNFHNVSVGDPVFVDNFESGGLSRWSIVINP